MRTTRLLIVSLLALLLLAIALPLAAQEEGSSDEGFGDAPTPAVVIVDQPAPPPQQPWTSRFLVPTGLVLGGLAVFATVVQYFVRVVRTRYKVVE